MTIGKQSELMKRGLLMHLFQPHLSHPITGATFLTVEKQLPFSIKYSVAAHPMDLVGLNPTKKVQIYVSNQFHI